VFGLGRRSGAARTQTTFMINGLDGLRSIAEALGLSSGAMPGMTMAGVKA